MATGGTTGAYQVSIYKKDGQIHQNPSREHEDNGVKAQDVEQPQVVDPSVPQHLLRRNKLTTKPFWFAWDIAYQQSQTTRHMYRLLVYQEPLPWSEFQPLISSYQVSI